MTRGRGTFWPATATPPLWPSPISDSTWSAGRKFYIGKTRSPPVSGDELHHLFFFFFIVCHLWPFLVVFDSAAMRCS